MAVKLLVVTEAFNDALRKPGLEAIGEARRLADQNGGEVIALVSDDSLAQSAAQYGADQVLTTAVESGNTDSLASVIKQAVEANDVHIVLMAATDLGKDLAPRTAAALNAGLAEDCLKLEMEGDQLIATRPMYAGKVLARVAVKSAVKVATLRPNVFAVAGPDSGRSASAAAAPAPAGDAKITVKEFKASESAALDIAEAAVIATGGRGMKEADNFKMLEELAGVLGGAVGATRAAVDAGWRPHSDQVGQTGKTVSPVLYMMFGASGSIQHWAGMSGAKCIVAVNKNPEAPIMAKADYSIVGDLFEVLPALTEEIKKVRG
jgi:electron transfer flavoprotein alpha subunit